MKSLTQDQLETALADVFFAYEVNVSAAARADRDAVLVPLLTSLQLPTQLDPLGMARAVIELCKRQVSAPRLGEGFEPTACAEVLPIGDTWNDLPDLDQLIPPGSPADLALVPPPPAERLSITLGGVTTSEADVVINGTRLSYAQSMTLRVGIGSFKSEMSRPDALGNDDHGRFMAKAYHDHARDIEQMIISGTR